MSGQIQGTHPERWRILGLLGVAQLMLILDVTVVAIALPHIGADLGLDREALTWVVSGYTLAFGGFLLLGGRAADVFGARRLVLVGLVVFAGASLLAGLATSGSLLLAGRVTQGLAAALLAPAALSLVVTLFDGDERNRALGIWSALGAGGAALGVLLGGVLTAGPGWRWVLFINVPIALLLVFGLRTRLPAHPSTYARGRLDLLGAALVTAATGMLIYALIRAGDRGWATTATAALIGLALFLYGAFALRQRVAATPLMDLRLLVRRPVTTGTLLIFVATALTITIFFLGTFYFQNYRGYGALRTGLLFLPVAVATMIGANVAGRLIGAVGARALGSAGLLVAALGMAIPALEEGALAITTGLILVGAGAGAVFVVASATALGQIEPQEAGLASGILSTFHEFGASLGAAVVSSLAAASIAGATYDGFERGFRTGAAVAAASAVVAFLITPGRPTHPAVSEPSPAGAARRSGGRRFFRHYVEMVLVMLAGMLVLGSALALPAAALGAGPSELGREAPAVLLLGMGFSMTAPMIWWMRRRGHSRAARREMAGAMIVPSVAVVALLAFGSDDVGALLGIQHLAMLPSMLVVMLLRRQEYTHRLQHATDGSCGDPRSGYRLK